MTAWMEWEGRRPVDAKGPDNLIFVAHGHPSDMAELRNTLRDELRIAGVAVTSKIAADMAYYAILHWGWFGYADADLIPDACDMHGKTASGDTVDRIIPVVFAYVQPHDGS